MTVVHLKRGKWKPIAYGHPWVFSGAIGRIEDPGDDWVEVVGDRGDVLGMGLLSEQSDIRVRMVDLGEPVDRMDAEGFVVGLERAVARRARFGLPGETTVYRLVNSEGDGLPGLVVDAIGDDLVTFQLSTAPMARRREAVTRAIGAVLDPPHLLERPAPEKIARLEGFETEEQWHGPPAPRLVEASEAGVRFSIDTTAMQKTGHYADMREHRQWVARHGQGARVLDAYSYTGGFGLHAARAGASRVVSVDSSPDAIETVERNAELNEVEIDAIQSDVGDYLRSAYDRDVRFDIAVLDPPKLAPSRKHARKALKVYESVGVQAGRLLDRFGMLCLGSCSEAIGETELERVFGAIGRRLERPLRIVRAGGHAVDHPYPAGMSEARYLTFIAAQLG